MSSARDVAIVVIAKTPQAGRTKTRLCPPCSSGEADRTGDAALWGPLALYVAYLPTVLMLALEGEAGRWLPDGFEVVRQRGAGLGERLAYALIAAGGPAIVVGMDTPQLTPKLLDSAAARLVEPGMGAVRGAALDGGYWTIGLRRPDAAVFRGVPMSSKHTCSAQRARLRRLGLPWAELPALRDVDTIADARAVAAAAPQTGFARALAPMSPGGCLPAPAT